MTERHGYKLWQWPYECVCVWVVRLTRRELFVGGFYVLAIINVFSLFHYTERAGQIGKAQASRAGGDQEVGSRSSQTSDL